MLFYTQADKEGIISARLVYTGKSEITDFSICFSLLSKCSANLLNRGYKESMLSE